VAKFESYAVTVTNGEVGINTQIWANIFLYLGDDTCHGWIVVF